MRELGEGITRKLLADPNRQEVLTWLRGAAEGEHRTLGILADTSRSIALAEEIYRAGASEVWAVDIRSSVREYIDCAERHQNTGKLVLKLPDDPELRRRVFEWERRQANALGLEGRKDEGQQYLFVPLD